MSDFDKEAEREKLREQFAEDEQKRETTERMSELLLQGATMTNTHCDTCGDPLFRYDGRTFCSTCQRAVGEDGPGDRTEPEPDVSSDTTTDAGGTASEETTMDDGQRIAVDGPNDAATDRSTTGHARESDSSPERESTTTPRARRAPPSQSSNDSTESRPGENVFALAETEASLARTLHRQANAAEETDDLGRTREHLAAAREAAEALEAVRNAQR